MRKISKIEALAAEFSKAALANEKSKIELTEQIKSELKIKELYFDQENYHDDSTYSIKHRISYIDNVFLDVTEEDLSELNISTIIAYESVLSDISKNAARALLNKAQDHNYTKLIIAVLAVRAKVSAVDYIYGLTTLLFSRS